MCATQADGKAILSFERQAAAEQQEENAAERIKVGGGSVFRPSASSGDQFSGVPSRTPVAVNEPVLRAMRASPKSVVTTRPLPRSIRMFDGVRSRCTTPLPCA